MILNKMFSSIKKNSQKYEDDEILYVNLNYFPLSTLSKGKACHPFSSDYV